MRNSFITFLFSLALLIAVPAQAKKANRCSGLSNKQCLAKKKDCSWISASKKKNGTKQKAYCRKKPSKKRASKKKKAKK